jgi:hypothetical protein
LGDKSSTDPQNRSLSRSQSDLFNGIRVIRIMELITDNFTRRLHHPEAITCSRRDFAFTIAPDPDRAGEI